MSQNRTFEALLDVLLYYFSHAASIRIDNLTQIFPVISTSAGVIGRDPQNADDYRIKPCCIPKPFPGGNHFALNASVKETTFITLLTRSKPAEDFKCNVTDSPGSKSK
jgi:hypothetical protein